MSRCLRDQGTKETEKRAEVTGEWMEGATGHPTPSTFPLTMTEPGHRVIVSWKEESCTERCLVFMAAGRGGRESCVQLEFVMAEMNVLHNDKALHRESEFELPSCDDLADVVISW